MEARSRHLIEVSYNVFGDQLNNVQENDSGDMSKQVRIKWLKIARDFTKMQAMVGVFKYLKNESMVSEVKRVQRLVTLRVWKRALKRHYWMRLCSKLISRKRERTFKIKAVQIRELRASETAKYLLKLPEYANPDFSGVVKRLSARPLATLTTEEELVREEVTVPPKVTPIWLVVFVVLGFIGIALGWMKCDCDFQHMLDFITQEKEARRTLVDLVGPYEYLNK